ncbi:MAG: beta-ketoacyl-[acyl-carrier-protein] synthase family protein, partial [Abitibacteriaceae bacterium]|nr:beta-ketoacyl-[acyl-carrier-protein] synthase family protein [Abditibacteriaceae bacterium]
LSGIALPATPDFACLTSRLLAELNTSGLWHEAALTVDPQRVAISFAASKGRVTMRPDGAYLCGAVESTGHWPALALARYTGSTGPVLSPVAACATGAHTIATGAQLIEDGYADVVLAGALENGLTPLVLAGYKSLGAISAAGIMRPFDRRRDGFLPAEGMACLILEDEEKCQARGAAIYGYVAGSSMQADATAMTTMNPTGDTIARAIEVALAKTNHAGIDYINAHGTATKLNDVLETRGIKLVFGQSVPVTATKPLTGHLLGATGAVEAVLCLLAMQESYAPPTLNLEEPEDECDLDYIPQQGRTMNITSTLSLSYGFGGHCGVLIFSK